MLKQFPISTSGKSGVYDITQRVQEMVTASGITNGLCCVFIPHTTAAVVINEHADPSVMADLMSHLEAIVPGSGPYRHLEGNSPAHIKSSLLGQSVSIPIKDGRLALGTWQGIFLLEFDGPRTRMVEVQILS